jgi:dihydroceramide fatty acyl 2-hydroxylase
MLLFTHSLSSFSLMTFVQVQRSVVHTHSEAARDLLQRFAIRGRCTDEVAPSSSSSSFWKKDQLNSTCERKKEKGRASLDQRGESFGVKSPTQKTNPSNALELAEEYNSIRAAIDRNEPLLFKVGKLREKYQDWVHRPEPGKPRFFQNDICENLSKTNWYVIPLVWLPVVVYLSRLSHQRWCGGEADGYGCHSALLWFCFLFGTLFWSLVEYAVHRFLFHVKTSSYWLNTLHFLFHGCHHKFPMDNMRLVMPPLGALPIVLMVYGVEYLMFGKELAPVTLSGTLTGYMCYDMLHYHCHFSDFTNRFHWLKKVRSSHMDHHYRDSESGFGISTPLWDVILTTHRLSNKKV